MAAAPTDPIAHLRDALRQPDRRTWRRFLPAARGAHRLRLGPDAGPWAEPPPNPDHEDGSGRRGDRRLQPWQAGAGVLTLAAGIVLATGLLPADRPTLVNDRIPPTTGSGSGPAVDRATVSSPSPSPTVTTTAVRVWPAAQVEVAGRQVRTDAGRWEVGVEGDMVTVGDWDCDRLPTPAVLRPADGRVAVFDRWAPAEVEESARSVGVVAGAVGLQPGNACGEVEVRTAEGMVLTLSTLPTPAEAGS